MKNRLFSAILSLFTFFPLFGQLSDDFSGPEVNSQVDWQGALSLFRVSDDQQLQLYDLQPDGSSETILYTTAPTSQDAPTSWNFRVQLDFSPSTSNFARIYLGASTNNLPEAEGYYLQVGGISGSDDALTLYRQDSGGDRTLILSGQTGAVGADPATARVRISRDTDGIWTLESDYTGGTDFQLEDTALDATYDQLTYFGLYCRYTSTRSELFFFDDILIDPLFTDTTPPQLDTVYATGFSTVLVQFSEPYGQKALQNGQYLIEPGLGSPASVTPVPNQDNAVVLNLNQAMQNLQNYQLRILEVDDPVGNTATELSASFSVFIPERPAPGDLLLTEVLFNPQVRGNDFIELYNPSNKVLDINGLIIRNTAKISGNIEEQVEDTYLLLPGQYVALTDEEADIRDRYPLPDTANIFESDLPTLDADAGNVSLFFGEQLLQSFDYSDDLHNPLLDNERGVSLERLSLLLADNDPRNWVSAAAATGFATPGYANTQNTRSQVSQGNLFELENTTFSPDGDSFEDLLILNYQTQQAGYLANIKVFDANGRPITDLSRNEALASRGLITWDGTNSENARARTGIYVIWIEIFTPDGDKQVEKLTCVLANRE